MNWFKKIFGKQNSTNTASAELGHMIVKGGVVHGDPSIIDVLRKSEEMEKIRTGSIILKCPTCGQALLSQDKEALFFRCQSCPEGQNEFNWSFASSELVSITKQTSAASTPHPPSIQEAARDGDMEKVGTLLRGNPDLVFNKAKWAFGMTALHMAGSFGRKSVAELLVANKADVNAKDENGKTPLHLAVANGHADVGKLLLANKAEVNGKDNDDETPLHLAARYGHKGVADLLLACEAEVNATNKGRWTPLHLAAADGHADLAELLLANKADVNAEGKGGETPLDMAAFNDHRDVVELLRQHGGHE